VYRWKYAGTNRTSVEVMNDVRLAQYDVIDVNIGNMTQRTAYGNSSVKTKNFPIAFLHI